MKLHCVGAILLILNLGMSVSAAIAADPPWLRYDNPHFTAYSNAPEKQTRQLLEDLEIFRAAFLQVGNVEVPASAPKTQVLITVNSKEYLQLASGKNTGGFAFQADGRSFIVMPASGGKKWSSTVIRHEYGHILLRHKKFPYPSWYEEGFAELVSATELTNKGASFMVGKPPDRAKYNGPPLMEWDFLVSDEFDPHKVTDRNLGSSAYAQAWLLAHYTTLGDNFRNARKLQAYFDLLEEGMGSTAAFAETFETTPGELWDGELKAYTRRIPVYTFQYLPGAVQTSFSQVAADDREVQPVLEYLRLRSVAAQAPATPPDPLSLLPGSWAPLSIAGTCQPASRISVDRVAATISVETDHGDDTEPDITTFGFTAGSKDELVLTPVADPEGAGDEEDVIYLKVKAANLFCWGRTSCAVAMRKCAG